MVKFRSKHAVYAFANSWFSAESIARREDPRRGTSKYVLVRTSRISSAEFNRDEKSGEDGLPASTDKSDIFRSVTYDAVVDCRVVTLEITKLK